MHMCTYIWNSAQHHKRMKVSPDQWGSVGWSTVPKTERLWVLFLIRGHIQVVSVDSMPPVWACMQKQPINVSVSLCLSLSLSVSLRPLTPHPASLHLSPPLSPFCSL